MLAVRALTSGIFQLVVMSALLLIPAGTWHWPRAIQFLVVCGILNSLAIVVFAQLASASLEARLQPALAKSQPIADRVITVLLIVAFLTWFAFIPIDVFHLKLFPQPSLAMSIFGACVFFLGYGFIWTTIYQNAFASPIVKDQSDRGHKLVDTGLYGHIRHPLYLGLLVYLIGISLWLESYAGLLALLLLFILLIARIKVEERTLIKSLTGYAHYTRRVRYRLIPFVW